MQDDKTLSIRVPLEMAHALESRLQAIRASRKPGDRPHGDDWKVDSISDLVRECISLGLKVNARDPDLMRELADEYLEDDLCVILASGYSNPRAYKILKKIAADSKPEPDFG
jgi:hypothetical protein